VHGLVALSQQFREKMAICINDVACRQSLERS
jgi:hypothetical protein